MGRDYRIRSANQADLETLIAFTISEARESQEMEVDAEAVRRGVDGAFSEPPRARYWIAEDSTGRSIATASVVTEWSDFHGGEYWWVQSLYVVPDHRGCGVTDLILAFMSRCAATAGALDLRLYVHHSNLRARRAYERCGFIAAPFTIMRKPLPGG